MEHPDTQENRARSQKRPFARYQNEKPLRHLELASCRRVRRHGLRDRDAAGSAQAGYLRLASLPAWIKVECLVRPHRFRGLASIAPSGLLRLGCSIELRSPVMSG